MQIWRYRVRFHTPAFLGDADQNGQWRTPPFKAQLRQWWRVAYAANKTFAVDTDQMRRDEGLLFGNAWLSHRNGRKEVQDHCRSLVQLRLGEWRKGEKRNWNGLEKGKIFHPEVENAGYKVGPHLYLGYGPLDYSRRGTHLDRECAIDHDETAELRIRVPDEYVRDLQDSLALMHGFGALGSRCRNGWGAYSLEPLDGASKLPDFQSADLGRFFRPWRDCLEHDWPHAIGCGDDGRPLIWTTEPRPDWREVLRDLALIRMGVRTQFEFVLNHEAGDREITTRDGKRIKIIHGKPQQRHWLAYPVTNHDVSAWNKNTSGRLPNTLRFTVRPAGNGKLQGVIFHMPCKPPSGFKPDKAILVEVWNRVHDLLNELGKHPRERRYEMISDTRRRNDIQPHLDEVTINRSQGGCP